jgi:glycosyltransferase involved in cell wall biosynthesis
MSQPIHVVFLIAAFFPKPTGATYSATRLARELKKKGVRLHIFTGSHNGWTEGEAWEDIPVTTFSCWEPGKRKKAQSIWRMIRLIRSGEVPCDIFHIHGGGHMNLLIALAVRLLCRVKVMLKMTLDGWDTPDGVRREKWGPLCIYSFLRLDGVVAMTSGQKDKCMEAGYSGVLEVIPNGVDSNLYSPLGEDERLRQREVLGIAASDIVLVYVGWLGKRKGTDVLADVYARLRQDHSNLKLLLVGDYLGNREAGTILDKVGLSDLSPRKQFEGSDILCTGPVDNAEFFLQAADIFVFPSRQEGFGTVQIEAMACGLPCAVNDLPGVSVDIYPDDTVGCRVRNNNPDEWAGILKRWIENPELRKRVGQCSRQWVETHFSLESVGKRYGSFYDALLRK